MDLRVEASATVRPLQGPVERGAAGPQEPQKPGTSDTVEVSPEARRKLAELKARDQEVRAHEAAHMAAGGSLVKGGASFTYQRGPDGGLYAVGGEVSIDTSPERDPRATLAKAERIRAAALAPSDPSSTDRAAAAAASAMAAQAAAELARQNSPGLDLRA